MSINLQNRANSIKGVIWENPMRGAELLSDFAERYGADTDVGDEILLIQFELNASSDQDPAHQKKLVQKLVELTDQVAERYDQEKVAARLQLEQEMIEAAKKRKLENGLVLAAEGIEKKYRSSRFHLFAEKLELRLGEITGLVGENATGKTTLLRILAGDLALSKGQVRFPLLDPQNKLDWGDIKMKIAFVPQELPAWEGPLVEALRFEASRHGILGEANRRTVDYIIQRLGLALHTEKAWAELSGGYKLRFALAKALVSKPQLLILDEPLAFLDIKTQMVVLMDIQALAKSLRDPISVLISSQHLHEVESVADQMLFMRDGHLENLGPTEDIGQDRRYNLFEVGTPLSFKKFEKILQDLEYSRAWDNGVDYYVATPLSVDADQILQLLLAKGIEIRHFRDISTSVKTKFYENFL
ncbi:MAG TPA: ABC transporter ATP-binding protein [Saprospiraceae bacterium]|nr:ABC transporter ATP-binding protein [Saprospiraceae bacterium]